MVECTAYTIEKYQTKQRNSVSVTEMNEAVLSQNYWYCDLHNDKMIIAVFFSNLIHVSVKIATNNLRKCKMYEHRMSFH